MIAICHPVGHIALANELKNVTESGNRQALHYLKGLSIEQLLQTEITSVSKKPEPLFDTAAAVSVITEEDIRRAGVHSIPEALRMVPGVNVAQIDGSRWAISSRGFGDFFANKMLVLIDGRSVYTPLFSGVYWNAQDTFINDIERIEVIRGPGASVWGANAVNGVINIITKNSADTQGGLTVASAGTHEQPYAGVRYGGKFDMEGGTYKVFAKGFNRAEFKSVSGENAHDRWQSLRTGFRTDFTPEGRNTYSLQGELYGGDADVTTSLSGFLEPPHAKVQEGTETYSGGHLLADWKHEFTGDSVVTLQLYYDRTKRNQVIAEETRDTVDLDFKHEWGEIEGHDIVWGVGYRWTQDDITGSWSISFTPERSSDNLWSSFLQDDILLIEGKAWLTVGSKFEHNDYTGFEIQPTARFRFKPAEKQLIWTSVSRAVRTPSRAERNLTVNLAAMSVPGTNILTLTRILGSENFVSEELLAYEAGYRVQPNDELSLDFAAFYNDYDNLRSVAPGSPFPEYQPYPPHLVVPLEMANEMKGESYGFEFQATWQVTEWWKLFFTYNWLELELDYSNPGLGTPFEENSSPNHQFHLRSYLDLPHNCSLDGELYYVSELDSLNIDSYIRFDLRFAWMPRPDLELSLNGENLFNSRHQEYSNRSNIVASEIPTQVWAKVTFHF